MQMATTTDGGLATARAAQAARREASRGREEGAGVSSPPGTQVFRCADCGADMIAVRNEVVPKRCFECEAIA